MKWNSRRWEWFFALLASVCFAAPTHASFNFTTLNDPLGVEGTSPHGVYGNTVVGYYTDASGLQHGFVYNGSTFSTLDDPLATNGTEILGIYGSTFVGTYFTATAQNGFIYNGSSFTTISDPSATSGTAATGVWGNTTVGYYFAGSVRHGFTYTNNAFTQIDYPQSAGTSVSGISGNVLVGSYNSYDAFKYNGSAFTTITDPAANQGSFTGANFAEGISGSLIVGVFSPISGGDMGFLYDGNTFTTLDDPLGTEKTIPLGINGSTVVGVFDGSNNIDQGFIVTVPEPTGITLACMLGASRFLRRRAR